MAGALIAQATDRSGRPWRPTAGIGPTPAGCWAPNPAARRPAGAATGRAPGPPWSSWPAGVGTATTVTTGIPTANDPAAPLAATSAARSGTAARCAGRKEFICASTPTTSTTRTPAATTLGSGWATLDAPGQPLGVPRTPPEAGLDSPSPPAAVSAGPPRGSLGSPGRSALAAYRSVAPPS